MSRRPKLTPPSETTRRLAALLAEETTRWADVTVRPMFGMRALFRGVQIFALLPDKRSLERPTTVAFKLQRGTERKEGEKWRLVELESEEQVAPVLAQLERAYRRAVPPKLRNR